MAGVPGPYRTGEALEESRPQCLHAFVAGAAAAFGGRPADVVERALALAGLAVQTVRRVGRLDLAVDRLVDARRTERDAGGLEDRSQKNLSREF